MKVFVTGASGFVGSAVVKTLLSAGHEVLALSRSAASAEKLKQLGVSVFNGDLADPDSLRPAVSASDAVIHLGFIHDFSRFKDMCELDAKVIATIGAELEGTQKSFLITSAIGVIKKEGIVSEADRAENSVNPRLATEHAADQLAEAGIRVSIIRLPPVVHDQGDEHGFIPMLIRLALQKECSAYIDEGSNLWPAVHRMDAAQLYVLALEKKSEPGTRYHAIAEQGIAFRKIAEAMAVQLGIPALSIKTEEVDAHFTWFSHFARFDFLASAKTTQQSLAWYPQHSSLLDDLEGGAYEKLFRPELES